MNDAPQFTADQVMDHYQQTKTAIEAMSKRHAEEMEPLNKRMDLLKAWLLDYLNKNGLENARTEHGLFYKTNTMSVTVEKDGEVDGWQLVLDYIFKHAVSAALDCIEGGGQESQALEAFRNDPSLTLLNRGVNKTAVKDMLDQGVSVPGVKIAQVVNLGVRKA